MHGVTLFDVAILLCAMAIAAPIARWLGIGTVLGYLIAGVLLGPHGPTSTFYGDEANNILHFAEFGVVFLLFLIGLELRPTRLWAMRQAILGLGGAQVALTAALISAVAVMFNMPGPTAIFIGLALALSSTAFALQILEENKELQLRHGRLAFAVLLFQDLAAIPLIALVPLFALSASTVGNGMDAWSALSSIGILVVVIAVGHLCLDQILRLIARTNVKEAMTAAALLTVIGFAIVMQQAGLSPPLGAFIAGAILAESSYRHQLEADIAPFEGLLLGLFFTAIGMSLNLSLLGALPLTIAGLTAGLVALKAAVLYGLGRWYGLVSTSARRMAFSLSQGGEFAFVLLTAAAAGSVIAREQADILAVVVTLSMALTPILLIADRILTPPSSAGDEPADGLPRNDAHVVIAGFGRYGQIVARVLRAKQIPFTALDDSADQIDFVERFGSKAFFGDASRPDILDAAQTGKARAFILAIDDVEASIKTAQVVRSKYPALPIYARTRNRNHAHRLLDLGIEHVERETFRSALATTADVLRGLGFSEAEIKRTIDLFQAHDERRLLDDYKHFSDVEKLQAKAKSDAETLAALFSDDEANNAPAKTDNSSKESTTAR